MIITHIIITTTTTIIIIISSSSSNIYTYICISLSLYIYIYIYIYVSPFIRESLRRGLCSEAVQGEEVSILGLVCIYTCILYANIIV